MVTNNTGKRDSKVKDRPGVLNSIDLGLMIPFREIGIFGKGHSLDLLILCSIPFSSWK